MKVEVVVLLTIVVVVVARWVSRKATHRPTTVTVDRGVTVVRLAADALKPNERREATRDLLKGLVEEGADAIVVDLGSIEGQISNGGMSTILAAFKAHDDAGKGVFAVACPPGRNRRAWDMSRLGEIIPTRDSIEQAMELFETGAE